MADTVRTKAALQTLLADNTSKAITPQTARDVLVSTDPEGSVTTAALASIAANQKGGFLFLPSNGGYLYRDTAAAWAVWGPIWPCTQVVQGSYSWVNQGGAAESVANGPLALTAPASAALAFRARVKTAPATPYTVTTLLSVTTNVANTWDAGLVFRESSSGKLVNFALGCTGGPKILFQKYSSATAFSATYTSTDANVGFMQGPFVWMQIGDDGTNLTASYSNDGFNFYQFDTRLRGDYFTGTGFPDQVGYYADSQNSKPVVLTVWSWKEA